MTLDLRQVSSSKGCLGTISRPPTLCMFRVLHNKGCANSSTDSVNPLTSSLFTLLLKLKKMFNVKDPFPDRLSARIVYKFSCASGNACSFSNRTGTSGDDGKARGKDLIRFPVPNLSLCHWSRQLFDLGAPSSTDAPVLLLNQPWRNKSILFHARARAVVIGQILSRSYVFTGFKVLSYLL